MSISIRREFGGDLAKIFLDDLQFQRSKFYYFLGGVEPWSGVGGEGLLDRPPVDPLDVSAATDRRIRSEILFAKQIAPNDISLAVRRIEWTANTVYDKWDNTIDMVEKNFYVLSSDNHVFKCLDNGSLFGEAPNPSTVEPSIVSLYPFTTIDGYLWKYMYTVTPYFRTRFSSAEFMPVKRAISESFYNNGSIDAVAVVAEGSGYLDAQLTFINVSGPTTGTGASATLSVNVVGTITGVTITNPGSGYTKGVRIGIDSVTGAGGLLEAVTNTAGEITAINVVEGGIGYLNIDTVTFVLGGAVVIPVISNSGSIVEARIIDGGVGYNGNPTLEVVSSTGEGSGAFGNPTALLEAVEFEGTIRYANIIDPGTGYPKDSDTTITVQGDGSGAVFSPLIYEEKIIDVIVENPGSGYTNSIITVNSTFGSGAILRGVITPSDFESRQAVVEQTAIPGAIYAVNVVNGGSGYSAGTTVEIRGNGTGARGSAVIVFGQIKRINMIEYGQGYTWAEVVITDPTRPQEEIIEESRAVAYPILPPVGGHGKDAPNELFCTTVAINTPLRGDLNAQSVIQDYRLFGIIKNPTNLFTGAKFSSLSSLLTFTMRAQDTTFLAKDQVFIIANNRYRVIDYSTDSVVLLPLDRDTAVPLGILSRVDDGSVQMITTELIESFDMDKYSGKLLYVSSDPPFEFNEEQSITIKTFITF